MPRSFCSATDDLPSFARSLFFPTQSDDGLAYYVILLSGALLITIYCLFRIRQQRQQYKSGKILEMKHNLLPLYRSFLWFSILVFGMQIFDILIAYLVDDATYHHAELLLIEEMPWWFCLLHCSTFLSANLWLVDFVLCFLSSNSHGKRTISRSFIISCCFYCASIALFFTGIQTSKATSSYDVYYLCYTTVYLLQLLLVLFVLVLLCRFQCSNTLRSFWSLIFVYLLVVLIRCAASLIQYNYVTGSDDTSGASDAFSVTEAYQETYCLLDLSNYLSYIIIPWLVILCFEHDSKYWYALSSKMLFTPRNAIYYEFKDKVTNRQREYSTVSHNIESELRKHSDSLSISPWVEMLSQHVEILNPNLVEITSKPQKSHQTQRSRLLKLLFFSSRSNNASSSAKHANNKKFDKSSQNILTLSQTDPHDGNLSKLRKASQSPKNSAKTDTKLTKSPIASKNAFFRKMSKSGALASDPEQRMQLIVTNQDLPNIQNEPSIRSDHSKTPTHSPGPTKSPPKDSVSNLLSGGSFVEYNSFRSSSDTAEADLFDYDKIRRRSQQQRQQRRRKRSRLDSKPSRRGSRFLSLVGGDESDVEKSDFRTQVGGSAKIMHGLLRGQHVAVKEWTFRQFTKRLMTLWCKEILILSNFEHPNIVPLKGLVIEPPCIKIVMKWCRYGTLRDLLLATNVSEMSSQAKKQHAVYKDDNQFELNWRLKMSFVHDVAAGMNHLHATGVLHRDLKTQNLLIDIREPSEYPGGDRYHSKTLTPGYLSVRMGLVSHGSNGSNGSNTSHLSNVTNNLGRDSLFSQQSRTSRIAAESRFSKYIVRICDFGSARAVSACGNNPLSPRGTGSMNMNENYRIGGSVVAPRDLTETYWKYDVIDIFASEYARRDDAAGAGSNAVKRDNALDGLDGTDTFDAARQSVEDATGSRTSETSATPGKFGIGARESKLSIAGDVGAWVDNATLTEIVEERRDKRKQKEMEMSTVVGSIQFLAPEILEHFKFGEGRGGDIEPLRMVSEYDNSMDVYSFGCVLYEMIHHVIIYEGWSFGEIQKFVVKDKNRLKVDMTVFEKKQGSHKCPEEVKQFLIALLHLCWNENKYLRPDFSEVMRGVAQICETVHWD